jgi:uncharacterized protein (TIGR03067 family)
VTICPLCACHLHIPDRMVGQIVNCPECGKPFQVEDGAEEIEVLRGFQVPGPRPAASKRKSHGWVLLLIFLLAVPFLLFACAVPFLAIGWVTLRSSPEPEGQPFVDEAVEVHGPAMRGTRRVSEDEGRVAGVWQATRIERDGTKAEENDLTQTTWELQDGEYTLHLGTGIQRGHFELDSFFDPKWIDLEITNGPDRGHRYFGIYKLEDDKLVICLAPKGVVAGPPMFRPQEFSGQQGTGQTIYELRRKKD